MPKKKELKEELLEKREHMGVKYEIWDNGNELEYRVVEGLESFKITGSSKRSLTIQIKKEIEILLKAKEKKTTPEAGISLENMSKEELEELFNPDAYKDEEPEIVDLDTEPEEKVNEATVDDDDEAFADEQDWENESVDQLGFGTEEDKIPLTPEEIVEEDEVERLEEELIMGPADRGEEDIDEEVVTSEIADAMSKPDEPITKEEIESEEFVDESERIDEEIITKTLEIREIPKTKLKGELKFVIVDGKLYGQISSQTFVTIEQNKFKLIPANTYTNMRRGKTIRVMPLDILHILEVFDYEMIFRFLVINKQHVIGKSKKRMCIIPSPDATIMGEDCQQVLDKSRHIAMVSVQKNSLIDYNDVEPAGQMKYPRGEYDMVKDQIMFGGEDCRYGKEVYQRAQEILSIKPTKTTIDRERRLLLIVTKDESVGIVIAPLGEDEPEEEIDEIYESELDDLTEEE
jgi:hypothetical protein